MIVRIYSKPNCCLCEQAKAVLDRVRERIPFELLEEDIRGSPELFQRYRYDIPVVTIDGREAFRLRLDEAEVEAFLRRAMHGTPIAPLEEPEEQLPSLPQEIQGDGEGE
ncbi:MAG TPA: glutaredoxin family protein [Myxococcaceae bacterium]|nr:glutaredoxin family protein [Myxococcaceae bacterium]